MLEEHDRVLGRPCSVRWSASTAENGGCATGRGASGTPTRCRRRDG